MTSARIQSICRKRNINTAHYDWYRLFPRKITERNIALKIHNNILCLIWESNDVSFKKQKKS